MRKTLTLAFAVLSMLSSEAFAYDWSATGRVTNVEGTYFPSQIPFQMDQGGGNCGAGSWIYWYSQGSDDTVKGLGYQSMLAILMLAKASGQSVTIFGNNNGCSVQYVHLGNN